MKTGVGVIGAGTVGGGVIEILSANTDVIQDKPARRSACGTWRN